MTANLWVARIYLLIALVAMFILGQVCYRAWGATSDPFVGRLELLLGMHPGQLLPVDTRAPDIRLQYLGTRSVGHNDYDVRVRRVR